MTTPCTCARTAIGGYSGSTRSTSAGAFSSPPVRTGARASGGGDGGGAGGGGGGGSSLISPPTTPPTAPPGTPPSTPPGAPSLTLGRLDSGLISFAPSYGAAFRFVRRV